MKKTLLLALNLANSYTQDLGHYVAELTKTPTEVIYGSSVSRHSKRNDYRLRRIKFRDEHHKKKINKWLGFNLSHELTYTNFENNTPGHGAIGLSENIRIHTHSPLHITAGLGAFLTDAQTDEKNKYLDSILEFESYVGFGITTKITKTKSFTAEYIWRHLSNGGQSSWNRGTNEELLLLGVRFK